MVMVEGFSMASYSSDLLINNRLRLGDKPLLIRYLSSPLKSDNR